MLKNLMPLYSVSMCLVSSITIMVVSIMTLNSATDLILTNYKYSNELRKFANNDKYTEYKNSLSKEEQDWYLLDDEELTERRIGEQNDYLTSIKSESVRDIINYTSSLIVAAIFFIIHWKLYKSNSNIKQYSRL